MGALKQVSGKGASGSFQVNGQAKSAAVKAAGSKKASTQPPRRLRPRRSPSNRLLLHLPRSCSRSQEDSQPTQADRPSRQGGAKAATTKPAAVKEEGVTKKKAASKAPAKAAVQKESEKPKPVAQKEPVPKF
ncbi:hypothetical protein BV898_01755 [Hypsibius exemplaris]|uniref:Uncharacterized protein n=1 Tax=Hypsibius exemplaris TaxID=2072580 RepID=A0A1W0XB20_HYPEX|nr:hypothetical protein BV898_01755 [Hypsibius exemplaris]